MTEEAERPTHGTRDRIVVRTSILGIIANLILAAFKAVVGILSNSIAVTLDAVNNMSDAMSSVVTIIGTKLSGKKPDKEHPFGYGRIEYLTTVVIAAIILYAGITSLTESFDKILNPETADYSMISLVIITSAVFVKIFLGRYVKSVGERVNSGALVASGKDALFDAVLSASVLASAVIFITTGIGLEAYVGVLISLFIIKAGLEMIKEAVDELLGMRADKELTDAIKATILEEEGVTGAYDLILHSYGPDKYIGSVHVEVPATLSAGDIDMLDRRIAGRVFEKHGIILAGIGVYAVDEDEEAATVKEEVTRIAMSHGGVLEVHAFRLDKERMTIRFDLIVDFSVDDREQVFDAVREEVAERYPGYSISAILDIDV